MELRADDGPPAAARSERLRYLRATVGIAKGARAHDFEALQRTSRHEGVGPYGVRMQLRERERRRASRRPRQVGEEGVVRDELHFRSDRTSVGRPGSHDLRRQRKASNGSTVVSVQYAIGDTQIVFGRPAILAVRLEEGEQLCASTEPEKGSDTAAHGTRELADAARSEE